MLICSSCFAYMYVEHGVLLIKGETFTPQSTLMPSRCVCVCVCVCVWVGVCFNQKSQGSLFPFHYSTAYPTVILASSQIPLSLWDLPDIQACVSQWISVASAGQQLFPKYGRRLMLFKKLKGNQMKWLKWRPGSFHSCLICLEENKRHLFSICSSQESIPVGP